MQLTNQNSIILFVFFVLLLIILLCAFVVTLIYKYQQKRVSYDKEIQDLKTAYENTLLQSQLEVQEQTFENIAREIHDNIGQKLTLAKLYLNTITYNDIGVTRLNVNDSLGLITDSINSLSDISRSMGTEVLLSNGLVKAIEIELGKIGKTGIYQCHLKVSGMEVFFNGSAEIVIFRIVQECINNFLKHSGGLSIKVHMSYSEMDLHLIISDNGKGFDTAAVKTGAGLANIQKRAAMLNGGSHIESSSSGTTITIQIPINENTKQTNSYIG